MMRRLVFVLALAGCASAPVAPPLGAALSCSADRVLVCPQFGCTDLQPGEVHTGAVLVEIPAHDESGRACENDLCENVRVKPTLTSALGWTADLLVSEPDEVPVRRGEIEVAADRGSFHWRKQQGGELYVWRGLCQASGS